MYPENVSFELSALVSVEPRKLSVYLFLQTRINCGAGVHILRIEVCFVHQSPIKIYRNFMIASFGLVISPWDLKAIATLSHFALLGSPPIVRETSCRYL